MSDPGVELDVDDDALGLAVYYSDPGELITAHDADCAITDAGGGRCTCEPDRWIMPRERGIA